MCHIPRSNERGSIHRSSRLFIEKYGGNKEWSKRLSTNKLADGQFHKFAVAWTPSGYTFYIDDIPQNLAGLDQVPISIANQYIILSSEVPRNYPAQGYGSINKTTATFDVDYVKVYPYIPNGFQDASRRQGSESPGA
ncbi:hypothetical protein CKY10_05870 [Photorhabdus sp. HUG-39]|uniref:Family 16 glycosylhydrolase n=1 Tax=Photorhabdus kayaii TaxID=230088 RepID=A0ABX0AX08_9GAMM|nr:family 16 glycosylhydrolase [Photorhabdus kayaii]NDL24939.1 family 16 glycosylhydrolase [Photorhabdus kayaii]RAX10946.1 hypothetical protein CKY10_05870 [Photorhabdus sp. HUG-39]